MKIDRTISLFTGLLIIGLSQSCNKSLTTLPVTLHSARVLAATCPLEPSSTEVAVQLDNNDPLSFDWTNTTADPTYHHVIITFDPTLAHNIGRSLTYTSVRKPTAKDILSTATIAICNVYPIAYLDSVSIK